MNEPTGAEYYERIAYTSLPDEPSRCVVCNGASYVRRGDLVPGQFGFGELIACPRWRSDAKRCVQAMGAR